MMDVRNYRRIFEQVRDFHEEWGSIDVEDMPDAVELWERLGRILQGQA